MKLKLFDTYELRFFISAKYRYFYDASNAYVHGIMNISTYNANVIYSVSLTHKNIGLDNSLNLSSQYITKYLLLTTAPLLCTHYVQWSYCLRSANKLFLLMVSEEIWWFYWMSVFPFVFNINPLLQVSLFSMDVKLQFVTQVSEIMMGEKGYQYLLRPPYFFN